jgi:hypothetical protein
MQPLKNKLNFHNEKIIILVECEYLTMADMISLIMSTVH